MGAKANKKCRENGYRRNNSSRVEDVKITKPGLVSWFMQRATPTNLLIASTLTAGVALLSTDYVPYIEAESDPAIMAACPPMSEVKLATIPGEIKPAGRLTNTFTVGHLIPPQLMTYGQQSYVGFTIQSMERAKPYHTTHLDINSAGGNLDLAATYIYYSQSSRGKVITSASELAASAATLILFSGTKDRSVFEDTGILTHASRAFRDPKMAETVYLKGYAASLDDLIFEEDYEFDRSKEKELAMIAYIPNPNMREAMANHYGLTPEDIENYQGYIGTKAYNDWMRKQYVEFSDGTITSDCAKEFVRGKDDILVSPETALKFNWIDTVYNRSWWTDLPDGTMTVRWDDPRAAAYRQTVEVTHSDSALKIANGPQPY